MKTLLTITILFSLAFALFFGASHAVESMSSTVDGRMGVTGSLYNVVLNPSNPG